MRRLEYRAENQRLSDPTEPSLINIQWVIDNCARPPLGGRASLLGFCHFDADVGVIEMSRE